MLVLLWDAIAQLPLMQRRALLLHARDHNGGSAVPLLVFTGVATLDEIAAVLGYDRATMETLWDGLPMADLAIARLVRLHPATGHQSSPRPARERLERARLRLLSPRSKYDPRHTVGRRFFPRPVPRPRPYSGYRRARARVRGMRVARVHESRFAAVGAVAVEARAGAPAIALRIGRSGRDRFVRRDRSGAVADERSATRSIRPCSTPADRRNGACD